MVIDMNETNFVAPPWPPCFVQVLNVAQTGTQSGSATPAFVCAAREDGRHGQEGGQLGVLIATTEGWVCPHCDHVQDRGYALPKTRGAAQSNGPQGTALPEPTREQGVSRVEARIAAYADLAARGARGADVMLRSLHARLDEILAPPATMGVWVVYARPADYPDQYVARRFSIEGGRTRPTEKIIRADTLEALRRLAPPDLVRLARSPGDDPVIVESWLSFLGDQRTR